MKIFFRLITILFVFPILAQEQDSLKVEKFTIHAQSTVINQFKPKFQANYSGENSLSTNAESATSLTTTVFLGVRLWKGGAFYLNPEIAGGSGLSQTLGISAAPNGETFRIGNPSPKIYVARMFYRQLFKIGSGLTTSHDEYFHNHSDFNQLADFEPIKHISFTIGKISIADYFDDNKYSHDPRTQFLSWGLMSNGAWDYPANTRGYTPSIVIEYISPNNEWRGAISLIPSVANGNEMNNDIFKANSSTFEYVRRYSIKNRKGAFRILGFYTMGNLGSYLQSLSEVSFPPSVVSTRSYGRNKYGFGLNLEQDLTNDLGLFARYSWNDGRNETWAFTEIDRSLSVGIQKNGKSWKRKNDYVGLASVISGLSKWHKMYLRAGGKGFMLGDSKLNYALENLSEFYYSAQLRENIYLTGAYQLVINPGFNADRKGPVSVFSFRLHLRM